MRAGTEGAKRDAESVKNSRRTMDGKTLRAAHSWKPGHFTDFPTLRRQQIRRDQKASEDRAKAVEKALYKYGRFQ